MVVGEGDSTVEVGEQSCGQGLGPQLRRLGSWLLFCNSLLRRREEIGCAV